MSVRFALIAVTALGAVLSVPAQAVPLIGVVGPNQLIGFDSATPGTVTGSLTVTGIGAEVIRGIDFRPATGQLYGFGQAGTLFSVDTTTGAATIIGSVTGPGAIDFGFAFNPVPDRIRIVSADNTNLRVNPTNAVTIVDGNLAYGAGDVNFGVNPTVTGVAYTNQNPGVQTLTRLYGIDAATDSLVIQNPPNAGTLTTVGLLGVDLFDFGVGPGIGFDIDGATNAAFASLTLSIGSNGLYGIDLNTGAATLIGDFAAGMTVRDIAVGNISPRAVPEPASMAMLGLGLVGLAAARRRFASSDIRQG